MIPHLENRNEGMLELHGDFLADEDIIKRKIIMGFFKTVL